MTPPTRGDGWTPLELSAITEARGKLTRKRNIDAAITVAGLAITVLTFLFASTFVFAYGAMIFGPIAAIQAASRLKRLDALTPGTPLDARVLGVRTSIDAPRPSQKRAAIVVGAMLGAVLLAIVVMVVAYG